MPNTAEYPTEEIQSLIPTTENDLANQLFSSVEKSTQSEPTEISIQKEREYQLQYESLAMKAQDAVFAIEGGDRSSTNIGSVLRAWNYASTREKYLINYPTEDTYLWEEFWSDNKTRCLYYLENIFNIQSANSPVSEEVANLLRDETFPDRTLLSRYIADRLEFAHYRMTSAIPLSGESNTLYLRAQQQYESSKAALMPLLEVGIGAAVRENPSETLTGLLNTLRSIGERKAAFDFLLKEETTEEELLRYAVGCMNSFGVLPTVEYISTNLEGRPGLSRLYKTIEGEEDITQIMSTLSQVYKSVEFQSYVLNHGELTQREATLIEDLVGDTAKRDGKPTSAVRVFDVGAGTGRHAVRLKNAGYDVFALEYEPHHAKIIKDQSPDLEVVSADWHAMPLQKGISAENPPEVFYCLGRTILHNNTPEKMLRFFDDLQRVTSNTAQGVIDIPKISESDSGIVTNPYDKEITRFADHLSDLGVENIKSRNIFDGPDEKHKYNRMALTDTQFRSYAKLLGFKVSHVEGSPINEEGLFDNSYYFLEKDPDFDISQLTAQELRGSLRELGLFDPGVDYNTYVEAWGLPLGLAILYAGEGAIGIQEARRLYQNGELGKVQLTIIGNDLHFGVVRNGKV